MADANISSGERVLTFLRLRKDTHENWSSFMAKSPKNGELIIVLYTDEVLGTVVRYKIGETGKTYSQLPFLDEIVDTNLQNYKNAYTEDFASLSSAYTAFTAAVNEQIQNIRNDYNAFTQETEDYITNQFSQYDIILRNITSQHLRYDKLTIRAHGGEYVPTGAAPYGLINTATYTKAQLNSDNALLRTVILPQFVMPANAAELQQYNSAGVFYDVDCFVDGDVLALSDNNDESYCGFSKTQYNIWLSNWILEESRLDHKFNMVICQIYDEGQPHAVYIYIREEVKPGVYAIHVLLCQVSPDTNTSFHLLRSNDLTYSDTYILAGGPNRLGGGNNTSLRMRNPSTNSSKYLTSSSKSISVSGWSSVNVYIQTNGNSTALPSGPDGFKTPIIYHPRLTAAQDPEFDYRDVADEYNIDRLLANYILDNWPADTKYNKCTVNFEEHTITYSGTSVEFVTYFDLFATPSLQIYYEGVNTLITNDASYACVVDIMYKR